MHVCYFGVYDGNSPRNAMLIPGLRAVGVDVVECRAPRELLPGHSRGAGMSGVSVARARYELDEARRMVLRVLWLTRAFLRLRGPIDAVVLAEYNQGLAPLAFALARLRGAALILDFCLSLWDTAVNDRKLLGPRRPRAIYRKLLDRAALRLADRVLTETPATAEHFKPHLGLVLEKNRVLQLGAPEWTFNPAPLPPRDGRPLAVLYYGTWIPLHGVEFVIRAARILSEDLRFRFVFVGSGQTHDEVRAEYDANPSGNVEFLPYQPIDDLLSLLRRADVCVGVFGTSDKATQVVSNKVWQCLAMGRPVVTGNGPGARSILHDGEDCLMVPHGDPHALAGALRRLADDEALARRLSENAARLVEEGFTSTGVGRQLADVVAELIRSRQVAR